MQNYKQKLYHSHMYYMAIFVLLDGLSILPSGCTMCNVQALPQIFRIPLQQAQVTVLHVVNGVSSTH